MTVYMYDSRDASAPQLTRTAGSLASILKACLVGTGGTAYGSKASAGWTTTIDNTNTILLRNDSTDGSGRYFRIKDDGLQENGQSVADYQTATITGANNYTDINTLTIPFPRTISGDNQHSSTYYGCTIFKTSANNGTDNRPWRIVADNRTCYLFIGINEGTNTSITAMTMPSYGLKVYGFGDIGLLTNVTGHPEAFVSPKVFSSFSGWSTYNQSLVSIGLGGYMEHPLDNASSSTRMYVKPGISAASLHGAHTSATTIGYYHIFPSPVADGAVLEDIYVCDDTNNVVRSTRHAGYVTECFARLRGVKGCCHSLVSTAASKIGADWDTLQVDGRDYMLVRLYGTIDENGNIGNGTYAFDLTGPW